MTHEHEYVICKRGSGFACDGPVCGDRHAAELRVPTPDDEWNRPYPCDHWTRTRGCGGCDPGAIELQVLDDGTVLREGDPGWHALG